MTTMLQAVPWYMTLFAGLVAMVTVVMAAETAWRLVRAIMSRPAPPPRHSP